jgi:peptidyl-prolyl cis-trans isomerase C
MKQKLIYPVLVATLALALAQLPFAARATPAQGSTNLFEDPVVATGKGFEIKRSQLDEAVLNYSSSEAARGGSISDTDRPLLRAKLLDRLIVDRILLQMATPDDKAQVQKMVDDAINHARTNSPEAFEAEVKASGMTLEKMRDRTVEQQLCERVLVHETTNGVTVPDSDVKKFYDDNPSDFEVPERAHVAHILILTLDPLTQAPLPPDKKKEKEKFATDIRNRALNGEDFTNLVKQYSEDPGSKDKGGEYTFARNHQMVPEFEAAAFSLKTNQISDLVETKYGYHIIKLIEKLPASKEQFADVSPKIHDYLVGQQVNKGLPAYLEKLKAGANVKILDESLAGTGQDKGTVPAK